MTEEELNSLMSFDTDVDIDDMSDPEFAQKLVIPAFSIIDLGCQIKHLTISAFATFEICANNEHIAMAWTGVHLFDYEKCKVIFIISN